MGALGLSGIYCQGNMWSLGNKRQENRQEVIRIFFKHQFCLMPIKKKKKSTAIASKYRRRQRCRTVSVFRCGEGINLLVLPLTRLDAQPLIISILVGSETDAGEARERLQTTDNDGPLAGCCKHTIYYPSLL